MEAIQNLKATLPDAVVYSVAIQAADGGIFNDDILRYVAAQGAGEFFTAQSVDEMVTSLQWAYVDSACGVEPPGETEEPPEPPPCQNVQTNHYVVENTTNNPFYGIKFEFDSGTEIRSGGIDEFQFTVTAEEAAAMAPMQVEAKAGRRQAQGTYSGCQFDQPEPCDPVRSRRMVMQFRGATDNGDGTMTLTFWVKNNRAQALSHVTFGLPQGVTPSWPTNSYDSEFCLD
jgi:hypothetical protein